MPFKSLLGIGLAGGLSFLTACGNADSFSSVGSDRNDSSAKVIAAFDADGDGYVEVCHLPPGSPDDRHTIEVGGAAIESHLRHGDKMGPCLDDGAPGYVIVLEVDAGSAAMK